MFNIALFGAGRIGQVHAVNIDAHPQSRLYSLVEPFDTFANAFMAQYPEVKRQTVDEALNDPAVDAIVICSATDTHADYIELAAKHQKAIFCEKPIDLDIARVRDCLATVERTQVPFLLGFNRRFDPQFRLLKEKMAGGAIGKAASVVITSRDPAAPPQQYIQSSGGLYRDMAIHDFDMACYLLGESPCEIFAHGTCMVDERIGDAGDIDTSVAVLSFPSGATATIHNSRQSGYGYDQRIEVHGEKGMLQVANMTENLLTLSQAKGQHSAVPKAFFLERYQEAYQQEWQHFVEVLEGKPALCGAHDGLRALEIADAALKSSRCHKQVTLS
ncbi:MULTISPECIES: inositol 2-dehydrogenase [unclassified Vibrio]|uniref:Inositol 2-dehydrogenase n=1 Tax=Vibrio sp. HB236076 TaxID=3232307 RepID=A0AB39HEB7_9VIBR|nr:inositol 2-dehydrogenase [Vibrio sp. HB161653]MDP5252895.1 inositol 2-dehydrogenase [Vibrio sp. HB161653]